MSITKSNERVKASSSQRRTSAPASDAPPPPPTTSHGDADRLSFVKLQFICGVLNLSLNLNLSMVLCVGELKFIFYA